MSVEVEIFAPGELTPADLAIVANREHHLAKKHAVSMIEHALAAGQALREAKSKVAHGEWLPWLEANFDADPRTAQRYMQLADPRNATRVSHLTEPSLRKALEAVSERAESSAEEQRAPATELVAIADLKPHPRNYLGHPPQQIEHLVQSLRENGFYRPVVSARDGTILAGHGLTQAATELGMTHVPVTRLDYDPDSPQALKILTGDNLIGKRAREEGRGLPELLRDIRDEAGDLLGTGYDESILALLLLMTRSAAEISDANQAMEWIGLSEFEPVPLPLKLVLSFDTEDDRSAVMNTLGIAKPSARNGRTISSWWPAREKADPHSLRFVDKNRTKWQET